MILFNNGNGMSIEDDAKLLELIEGVSLAGVDVSGYRVNAETLATLYTEALTASGSTGVDAEGKPVFNPNYEKIKTYAAFKQKYLETFGAE